MSEDLLPPVVVGGVGGSGTRVIAEILIDLGVFMGEDLNHALDNLWFTYLFKRVEWSSSIPDDGNADFSRAYGVFYRAMRDPTGVAKSDLAEILGAARSHGIGSGAFRGRTPKAVWSARRIWNLATARGTDSQNPHWGWKEPNTHIFLPQLAAATGGMKYVHVMRNGLDMAFSENQQELRLWGPRFGIYTDSADGRGDPQRSLDYWIAANRRALCISEESASIRGHVVDFDELCRNPESAITSLAEFVREGLPDNALSGMMAGLASRVRTPLSTGRYRHHGLDLFSAEQMNAVHSLGYFE